MQLSMQPMQPMQEGRAAYEWRSHMPMPWHASDVPTPPHMRRRRSAPSASLWQVGGRPTSGGFVAASWLLRACFVRASCVPPACLLCVVRTVSTILSLSHPLATFVLIVACASSLMNSLVTPGAEARLHQGQKR